MEDNLITGSEALLRALMAEGVDTVFGYPGGQVIPLYDCLYDYADRIKHILVRHEQGATHAAQGYARVSGRPGVVIVTSGPGATNTITGIADAMMDSTPIVVISGQVPSPLLGSDAFQEIDVIGITQPVTKWAYQVRRADEVAHAVARAFYIASNGRPGPVVIDFAKDAQVGKTIYSYQKVTSIRSYQAPDMPDALLIAQAAALINSAERPMLLAGQGVILSGAEGCLIDMIEKADIPVATTMLGLSAIPSAHRLNKGMLGMHGNMGPNRKTSLCDVLIAIGMRFDDRVTGNPKDYAAQAKVIHFDIDPSEISKNVQADIAVTGDAAKAIKACTLLLDNTKHTSWVDSFNDDEEEEYGKVISKEIYPDKGSAIRMGEVVRKVSIAAGKGAVLVTDVGQNQMMAVRYFDYSCPRSVVTSGGLGTMGFGLPAAIGAKVGAPHRTVCLFAGDGGIQMTIQELGTVMQEGLDIKAIILNNNFLGMVRQWQELFFDKRYSATVMHNPDFAAIASAYGIMSRNVDRREDLDEAVGEMFAYKGAYLLVVSVESLGMVYPMVPAGAQITDILSGEENKES
ncbi:MAG: biosynthetic-type acetolactate synthase large subunit [Tannerellaceae bacterium]|nr:biosynthetic-type acetolactate synthase large subunit [Tannerellaceae bacterium]